MPVPLVDEPVSEPTTDRYLPDLRAPRVSRAILWAFRQYLPRYLGRHFHRVAVSFESRFQIPSQCPLIVYANHASWWDPLLGLLLAWRIFPDRQLYAPIDSAALKRYGIFQQLGFYGVDQDRRRGASQFLRASRQILRRPAASIWLTPEGRFADPRDHCAELQPGLAHLASELQEGFVLPLAVEYSFWEERLPLALTRFGRPLDVKDLAALSKAEWGELLEKELRRTQRELAQASIDRDSEQFQVLIRGRTGVGNLYDFSRRLLARLQGQSFQASHGEKLS